MRVLKLFSLTVLLSFFGAWLLVNNAQAQTNELDVAEFEADEVTVTELGLAEIPTTAAEPGYWWTNTVRNLDMFFTFNPAKKAIKEGKYANQMLAEVSQLAAKNPEATDKINKTLERFKKLKEKLADRLKNNQQIRERLQETIDTDEVNHQQMLREMSDKIPEDVKDKLEQIKKENALRWYEINKENVAARLKKVIASKNTDSKYAQFKHLATVEELGDYLPEEVSDNLEEVKVAAQEKLADKLKDLKTEEHPKLEAYVDKIKLQPVVKQQFLGNLKSAQALPTQVKNTVEKVENSYAKKMKDRFQAMSDEAKKKFLQQFDTRAHPVYIDFLNSVDGSQLPEELRNTIKNLKDKQLDGVRTKIEQTNSLPKLRSFEQNIKDPSVLREVRTRIKQIPIPPKPDQNLRPYQPSPTDNTQ